MFRMARSPTRAYYERRLHRLYARQQLRMHNNAKFYKCSGHSTPASHSRVAFNPWVVLSSHLSAARQNRIRVLPIQCPLASELIVFVIQYFIGRFELGFCFAPICVTLIALLYFVLWFVVRVLLQLNYLVILWIVLIMCLALSITWMSLYYVCMMICAVSLVVQLKAR